MTAKGQRERERERARQRECIRGVTISLFTGSESGSGVA